MTAKHSFNDKKTYRDIGPIIIGIISKLASYPFADKIVVTGSAASFEENPGDVDAYLNMNPNDDDYETARSLLMRLAKSNHGYFKPLISNEGQVFTTNNCATEWQLVTADKSKSIMNDIDVNGTSLMEVMIGYGINFPEKNKNQDYSTDPVP